MMIKQGRIPSTKNIDVLGYHTLGYSRIAPRRHSTKSRAVEIRRKNLISPSPGTGTDSFVIVFSEFSGTPSCICLLPHETRAIYKYSSQVGNVTCFGSEFAIFEGTSLKNRALCLTAHPCRASNGQARSVPDATGARRGGGGSPMSRKLEVTL